MSSDDDSAPTPSPESGPRERPLVNWPLRLLLIVSLVLLLLASLAEVMRNSDPNRAQLPEAAGTPGPEDELLVPGQRAGFILLGLPVKEVEARLGPALIRPSENAVLYLFERHGLTCGTQRDLVISVLVLNGHLHTRGGVAVGTDVDPVIREFGSDYEYERLGDGAPGPGEHYVLHYWSSGIHFVIKATKVESIQITVPVEGHSS